MHGGSLNASKIIQSGLMCVCVCVCVYEPRQHTAPKKNVKKVGSALDPLHREQLYVYHANTGAYDRLLMHEAVSY